MKKLLIYILTAFTVLTLPASAKIPASQRIRLTDQWEYLKGDLGSIWEAVRAVAPGSSEAVPIWQPVTLPHCFNAEDAVDPGRKLLPGSRMISHPCSIFRTRPPTAARSSNLKERTENRSIYLHP